MLPRPCILQYIINFPGSRGSSGDHWKLLRPCILLYIINFPGSRGSSGDHWMLLRPCILQYIINFPGSQSSSRRPLDAAQTVQCSSWSHFASAGSCFASARLPRKGSSTSQCMVNFPGVQLDFVQVQSDFGQVQFDFG